MDLGWFQAPFGDTSRQLIDAYIRRGDFNILVLDWSEYSVGLYTLVMYKMSKISRLMGRSLTKLYNKGLSDEKFHCVGHSFGEWEKLIEKLIKFLLLIIN